MQLADVEAALRLDLFDPAGSAGQRWSTTDLDRAIDKAVDRYSQYYPNIVYADMTTQPYQRTYPYPVPWNAAYPVWWIERILYPLQVYGTAFAPPTIGGNALLGAGTALNVGSYQYAVTFLTQGGETTPSPPLTLTTSAGNTLVTLSALPLGSQGPATNAVIGRNIYRTLVGGTLFYLLATVQDNSSSSYVDSTPDTLLASKPHPPTVNTSGIMLWPPRERAFAEYSNLFDSSTALAAGGNMGLQGSVGSGSGPSGTQNPSFTLQLTPAELPRDSTLVLRVFYATRHQLDSNGSTIPEVHRDIVVLGAAAYAMEAYQVPTNDNFDFQDGSIHDRIDDSKIPHAWFVAAQAKMRQFESRLQELKQQRDYAYNPRVSWRSPLQTLRSIRYANNWSGL